MKIQPVEHVPATLKRKKHAVQDLINQFRDSDLRTVEVLWDDGEYVDAKTCAASFAASLKKMRASNIRVAKRGDHVYLTKD